MTKEDMKSKKEPIQSVNREKLQPIWENMEYRMEHDTMGEVRVPANHLWGAQTQRSFENFQIGEERMPLEIVYAFALLKCAAAKANLKCGVLDEEKANAIVQAAERILAGEFDSEFPLKVWQTGSGTQSNMNMNEVIAHIAARDGVTLHPNDDVNCSQSSNDTFPTAMHISVLLALRHRLYPALEKLIETVILLEKENWDIIKIGRTHLQDAVPLRFGQEISGWRAMLETNLSMLTNSEEYLRELAIGGTAVGTGLNCPRDFSKWCTHYLHERTGESFSADGNKFHALTSKDACVFVHGALKALSANLMKIANDVRWLASGPRCGLGEIHIPENEPGSSIMPGKVNPTQCEAVTMTAVQVMGNDAAIGFAASQGNFELNVFMPVIAYNLLQSIRLLTDVMHSFNKNCLSGLTANRARMRENVDRSLMLVTCLTPEIGYEKAAQAAKKAHQEGITLKEAVLALGYLDLETYDEKVDPSKMV